MTKAPKTPNSRAKALAAMSKPELIKTIKALDKRQTSLLNELAAAKGAPVVHSVDNVIRDHVCTCSLCVDEAAASEPAHVTPAPPKFPWST